MIVIGIDPGTATTGYGVIRKTNGSLVCLDYGIISTKPTESAPERLKIIYHTFDGLLEKYNPDYAITERLFFSSNATTAIPVGRALGVILLAISQREIPWTEYTPTQVKNAVVGVGTADKKQVQYMVTRILNLKETPHPDDAADALAIAICHAHSVRTNNIIKPAVRG